MGIINWITGCYFRTDKGEFIITGVWWRKGKKSAYEFKRKDGKNYYMPAKEFHEKIKDEHYIGI